MRHQNTHNPTPPRPPTPHVSEKHPRSPPPDSKNVWYFAYGSNMSHAKFTNGRGILPLETASVRVPGYRLTWDVPGMPYAEPAYSSIGRRRECLRRARAARRLGRRSCRHLEKSHLEERDYSTGTAAEEEDQDQDQDEDEESDHADLLSPAEAAMDTDVGIDVEGRAYLLTPEQWVRVIASEGGGSAYADVDVLAVVLHATKARREGEVLWAKTLTMVPALRREPWGVPSGRYMELLTVGAREAELSAAYRRGLEALDVYVPPSRGWRAEGARAFVQLWGPVLAAMEKLTKASINREDGRVPASVAWVVRITVLLMWAFHDVVFAPVFGRGDGRDLRHGPAGEIDAA